MKAYYANSQLRLLFSILVIGVVLYFVNEQFHIITIIPVNNEPELSRDTEVKYETKRVKVIKDSGEEFPIESYIADTESKRSDGLSIFDNLDVNKGMLFVFDENSLSGFWMKGLKYSLDIAFIDLDKKIIYIKQNAQVCEMPDCAVFSPSQTYRYVLETNADWFKNREIGEGATIEF